MAGRLGDRSTQVGQDFVDDGVCGPGAFGASFVLLDDMSVSALVPGVAAISWFEHNKGIRFNPTPRNASTDVNFGKPRKVIEYLKKKAIDGRWTACLDHVFSLDRL